MWSRHGFEFRLVMADDEQTFLRRLEEISTLGWQIAGAPARWPRHAGHHGDVLDLKDPGRSTQLGYAVMCARDAFEARIAAECGVEALYDAD